jgi:micrococcal nuclease
MLRVFFILFSSLILFHPKPVLSQQKTGALEISKLVDGDTFWVKNEKGQNEKIRLIGINTPEVRRSGRTEVEFYGKEASDYVKKILTGQRVLLEYDVQRYDRYKRTLAYVYLDDGLFLNAHLIKEGYASVATFPPNVKYSEWFIKLEREARTQKKGMWKD